MLSLEKWKALKGIRVTVFIPEYISDYIILLLYHIVNDIHPDVRIAKIWINQSTLPRNAKIGEHVLRGLASIRWEKMYDDVWKHSKLRKRMQGNTSGIM